MEITALFKLLAENGVIAVLLIIVLIYYDRKDKALTESHKARIEDHNKIIPVIEATNAAERARAHATENRTEVIASLGEAVRTIAKMVEANGHVLERIRIVAETNTANMDKFTEVHSKLEERLRWIEERERAERGASVGNKHQ